LTIEGAFPTTITMTSVRVKDGESFEGALKRFKKIVEKAGILTELRKREFYEKPSIKRKRKFIQAVKRNQRKGLPRKTYVAF